jgi:hypothetical protein
MRRDEAMEKDRTLRREEKDGAKRHKSGAD